MLLKIATNLVEQMSLKSNLIFLYADSLNRDFSTCYILKNKLNENGLKSIICSRRNLGKFLKFLFLKKLFIVGQINMIPDKIIKAYLKGVSKIYFMPAEGYGFDNEYEVMYPDSDIYDSISAIYFGRKIPYNWFKNNRRINNINHLKITGYNRFPIAKAYREINIKNKSRIGFIGRFPASNDIYKRTIMWFFN